MKPTSAKKVHTGGMLQDESPKGAGAVTDLLVPPQARKSEDAEPHEPKPELHGPERRRGFGGEGSEEREVLEAVTCVRPEASACDICRLDA